MALYNWVLMSFGFLILVIKPYQAYGLSRGSMALVDESQNPPQVGLCLSAVTPHGYKCEEFTVKTKDGYILSMQRIPEGRVGDGGKNKQPVLLQHGVLVDGVSWVVNSPDESLAFILADSGFDVWISNTRGTRYSGGHVTRDATKQKYWDWSWDELVEYDLPAIVDFVYSQTGQKMDYVGHSLGTLIALASFSEGELVDKVRSAALLSPIAYLSHMNTALGVLAAKVFVGEITKLLGVVEFNPLEKEVIRFLQTLCDSNPEIPCYDLLTSLTGKNCCLNSSTVPFFLKNEPQSTSTKNMIHLAQTVRDGVVSKYDYGNSGVNMEHYGQDKPPIYDLTNIPNNFPLFISYGGQDALSDVRDIGLLLDSLKLHDEDKLIVQFVKDFAHADFIMGVSAKGIVYDALISFFNSQ